MFLAVLFFTLHDDLLFAIITTARGLPSSLCSRVRENLPVFSFPGPTALALRVTLPHLVSEYTFVWFSSAARQRWAQLVLQAACLALPAFVLAILTLFITFILTVPVVFQYTRAIITRACGAACAWPFCGAGGTKPPLASSLPCPSAASALRVTLPRLAAEFALGCFAAACRWLCYLTVGGCALWAFDGLRGRSGALAASSLRPSLLLRRSDARCALASAVPGRCAGRNHTSGVALIVCGLLLHLLLPFTARIPTAHHPAWVLTAGGAGAATPALCASMADAHNATAAVRLHTCGALHATPAAPDRPQQPAAPAYASDDAQPARSDATANAAAPTARACPPAAAASSAGGVCAGPAPARWRGGRPAKTAAPVTRAPPMPAISASPAASASPASALPTPRSAVVAAVAAPAASAASHNATPRDSASLSATSAAAVAARAAAAAAMAGIRPRTCVAAAAPRPHAATLGAPRLAPAVPAAHFIPPLPRASATASATAVASASASAPPGAASGVLGSSARSAGLPLFSRPDEPHHHLHAALAASASATASAVASAAASASAFAPFAADASDTIAAAASAARSFRHPAFAALAAPPALADVASAAATTAPVFRSCWLYGKPYGYAGDRARRGGLPMDGKLWARADYRHNQPLEVTFMRAARRVSLSTGGAYMAWEESCGTEVQTACFEYVYVGECDIVEAATGHVYRPVCVGGVWLNASSGKRLPLHMVGTEEEMVQFRIPPRSAYVQWSRNMDGERAAPVVQDDVDYEALWREWELKLDFNPPPYEKAQDLEHFVDGEGGEGGEGGDSCADDLGDDTYDDAPSFSGGQHTSP